MAQLPTPAAAWDELDLDDSDIRPEAPAPSSTPRSRATTPPSREDKPPQPSHHHHHIPEPASAVQDMTRRRFAASSPLSRGLADAQAPGADFLLPPWLCALQFLGKDRAWEQPGIKAIKDNEELCRAPLVAGVVTSCKPNGLGDLLLTLKDPSDTVAATVHKKVLLEGNNGQDISVGCVILLTKVAVFHPTRKASYLNITRVIKVFRKDCDAPSKQVSSSNATERSEGPTNNIMTRLLGHESMKPSNNEMTVIKVSLQHQGTSDSDNSTSIRDNRGRCRSNQEGGLEMLAGDPCRKNTLNCSTDSRPQQNLNIPNMICAQPSLCRSTVMFGDRYSTQASENDNLVRPSDNDKMLHSSKKRKSSATQPEDNDKTATLRLDTENNQVLKRNMNAELDGMSEQFNGQHNSIRESLENQQRNFAAMNAGSAQPTKEYSTAISGSPLNPTKPAVASAAQWTDDQLSELFADF